MMQGSVLIRIHHGGLQVFDDNGFRVIAPWTFESAKIESRSIRHDTREVHLFHAFLGMGGRPMMAGLVAVCSDIDMLDSPMTRYRRECYRSLSHRRLAQGRCR